MNTMTRYFLQSVAAAGVGMILMGLVDAGDAPPTPDPELLRDERRFIEMILEAERQRIRDRLSGDVAQALSSDASDLDQERGPRAALSSRLVPQEDRPDSRLSFSIRVLA